MFWTRTCRSRNNEQCSTNKWNFPIRYSLVFILKYVFSYRFYTSHIPYLWCKRIYTSCRRLCNLKNEIYDIGTKIIYFQCFVTTDMFLFCKSIFFSGMCHMFHDLAFGSIKTRLKASGIFIRKFACDLGFAGTVFIGPLPLEATKLWSLQCRHKGLN